MVKRFSPGSKLSSLLIHIIVGRLDLIDHRSSLARDKKTARIQCVDDLIQLRHTDRNRIRFEFVAEAFQKFSLQPHIIEL